MPIRTLHKTIGDYLSDFQNTSCVVETFFGVRSVALLASHFNSDTNRKRQADIFIIRENHSNDDLYFATESLTEALKQFKKSSEQMHKKYAAQYS